MCSKVQIMQNPALKSKKRCKMQFAVAVRKKAGSGKVSGSYVVVVDCWHSSRGACSNALLRPAVCS